ncbi:glutathione S-transferase family protein [Agrobacterium vitis]|nr:glutathione S-transferase family protein [Agrobacterium vitis]
MGKFMLKVYGRSNSSNSAKVFWLLAEMGIEYDRIDCGGSFGGNDTPEYLAMNPNGKVPTIEDDGTIVWESNAVLRYLASRHDAFSFWPAAPAVRAGIDQWMDWSATTLTPPIGRVRKALKNDRPEAEKQMKSTVDAFTLLDHRLGRTTFISGDTFSLADIASAPAVHRWFLLDLPKPHLSSLAAYRDRLAERPHYQTFIAGPLS